jgi:TolB protein
MWANFDIFRVSSSGGSHIQVTFQRVDDQHPSWSSDGTKIIYYSSEPGESWDIYSIMSSGGPRTRLTTRPEVDFYPAWSPDDGLIAFTSWGFAGPDLFVMPTEGGEATPVASEANLSEEWATWSPDGNQIAYQARGASGSQIWVVSATGGTPTQLTTHPSNNYAPAWSPRGGLIAFYSDRDGDEGDHDIWVVPVAGGSPTQITSGSSNDTDPAWSPDQKYIAFSSSRGGTINIWKIPVPVVSPVEGASWGSVKGRYRE